MPVRIKNLKKLLTAGLAAAATVAVLAGCSQSPAAPGASGADNTSSSTSSGKIAVVGAENHYSDVAAQIGGKYVTATAIMSNPNTDPHTFEASATVARELSQAQLVIQNGLGYDDFMGKLEKASPNKNRKVIVAQDLLGLPDSTDNPHLWYDPKAMPVVAKEIAAQLSKLQPSHASYFEANLAAFTTSLKTWTDQLATFKQTHPNTPVAVSEPVADYLLEAAGADIKTPWSLESAIMNDTDPSPQDTAAQDALFTGKKIKVFVYNQQVTDSITEHYLTLARSHHIPVVGVYETMPAGYHYQKWMEAELAALENAVTRGESTEKL